MIENSLISSLDLSQHIENLKSFLAREKSVFLQGDVGTNAQYAYELYELNKKLLPIKPLDEAIKRLEKKGVLNMELCLEFLKIIQTFNTLNPKENSKLESWKNKIITPTEITELFAYTKELKFNENIDENLVAIHANIMKKKEEIKTKFLQLIHSHNIKEFLIDSQIHYINEEECLLLRGGFSRVLKARIVSRSTAGFFFCVPEQVLVLRQNLRDLQDKKQEIIYKYEEKFSSILSKNIMFLKWINNEFDKLDNLNARACFMRANNLDLSIPQKTKSIILKGFKHPALEDPTPFDVEFKGNVLMITGVNAGGKTMLLKSILSAIFMSKYLIPFACKKDECVIGSFKNIRAIIQDPQSVKNDISTFAGRMKEFKNVLFLPDLILGVDEIELGTDSDEAASLFKILLENLALRGAKIIVTTHHKRLASLMAKHSFVDMLAAIYDINQNKPSFSFTKGLGKSYAFETAIRYGVPEVLVQKAKEVYGKDKENLNDIIAKSASLELAQRQKLAKIKLQSDELERKIQAQENAQKAQAIEFLERLKALETEYQTAISLAKQAAKAATPQEIHSLLNKAHKEKKTISTQNPLQKEQFKKGDSVKFLSQIATILEIKNSYATLNAGDKRLQAPLAMLEKAPKIPKKPAKINTQKPQSAQISLDLHGLRADEAIEKLDKFISDALIIGYDEILVYHGIGTGVLSRVVKEFLGEHSHVTDIIDAPINMGGFGATLAKLI